MATGSGTGTPVTGIEEYASEQLQGMRIKFRRATGLSSTNDITNDQIDIALNDFYKNVFVKEVAADNFKVDYTQAVTVDDDGEYSLASNILQVNGRITFNGNELAQYYDKRQFFGGNAEAIDSFGNLYPDQEQYNTAPGVAIGSGDSAKVYTAAFNYRVNGWTYSVVSTETTMTGDAVPQDTYGAWLLYVDADGDFTVSEATDNATGYSTPGRAVDGLNTAISDACVIGFVTVIHSSGDFTPGTTAFDDSGVTATFTDGDPQYRGDPSGVLIAGRKLFLRPKANDQGLVKAKLVIKRPDELSEDTSSVFNEEWGSAIAMGAAATYLNEIGDKVRAQEVIGSVDDMGTYKDLLSSIKRDELMQLEDTPFMRSW